MSRATKLQEFDTTLTADSVEWCPCAGLEQLLACGTYQLEEDGKRRGTLSFFEWLQYRSQLKPILELETQKISDGILDMKWRWCGERAVIGLAESSGCVTFVTVNQTSAEQYILCELGRADVALREDKRGICLSLDWDKDQSGGTVVAVSDSLGCVGMVEVGESKPRYLHGWKAHEYEAWITTFGHQPCLVFSGGDDSKLCLWDTRTGCVKPCFISRRHQMGVCSLQVHPSEEHLLASGSYDEALLLWDTRNMARPLKELGLGGGIWRFKWRQPDFAAVACMHNGFSIVNCHTGTDNPMEVVCSYSEHKSLAYGIDWCRLSHPILAQPDATEDPSELALLSSCSFYDHSLHLWIAKLPLRFP